MTTKSDKNEIVMSRTRSRRLQEADLRGRKVNADMAPQEVTQRQTAAPQQQVTEGPSAWEEFLDRLAPYLEEAGDKIRVLDRAGWVKVENQATGHKLYFNKGVTGVTRVESSLAPESVRGATPPEFYNGRITSIIPPTVQSVGEAIRVIAQVQERLAPPRRRTRDIG